jgi:hypothetical protein
LLSALHFNAVVGEMTRYMSFRTVTIVEL